MNAADVLAEARRAWRVSYDPAEHENVDLDAAQVAALLAHGEQGVAITPGPDPENPAVGATLWALGWPPFDMENAHNLNVAMIGYRLVPLEAEDGGTDG